MTLNKQQRSALKTKSHHLKPLIRVGQKGITDQLIEETMQTLDRHELIKIHIASDDRQQRNDYAATLISRCNATMINQIGKTYVFFKAKSAAA